MIRPRWKNMLRILGLLCATLFVLLAAIWTIANIYYGRLLMKELQTMKAAGFPLTIAEAKPRPVPAAQNAADVYLSLFQVSFAPTQKQGPSRRGLLKFEVDFKDVSSALAARPVMESPEAQQALRELKRASALPYCVFPIRWEDGFAMTFPHLAQFRQAARLMAVQAVLKAHAGQLPEAIEWLRAAYRMADHVAAEPSLIAQLVSIAMRAITDKAAQIVLAPVDVPVTLAQPFYLQLAQTNKHIEPAFEAAFRMELAQGIAFFTLLQKNPRQLKMLYPEGIISPSALTRLLFSPLGNPVLKLEEINYLRYMRFVNDFIHRSYYEYIKTWGLWPFPQHLESGMGTAITRQLVPVYTRVNMKRDYTIAQIRMLQTVLALKAYKAAQGRYPQTLADLSWKPPTEDPFCGKPFVYRQEGKGFLLYSVGPNLRDDGGCPPRKPGKINEEGDMIWRCPR